jgi:glycosyltransferase involved in cell wall biosynthesis
VAPPWYEIPPSGYGGIERVCFELVEGLVERGHDVTLVATGADRTRARYLCVLPEPLAGLGTVESGLREVRYAALVSRVLAESGVAVDLFHDHALASPLLASGRPAPTIVTAHGPADGVVGDYYRALALPLIAISDAQRRVAPDLPWLGTVHHSVDLAEYEFRADKDDYVLFLGRLSPEKGAHLAPAACRAAGVRLVLAGKCHEPEELRYFSEEVAPVLDDAASFVGEAVGRQKVDYLAGARCLIVPAMWDEPFGLACIEALACGTPVVALRRGALSELVADGRTGWLCDEPAQLPDAIRRAAEIDPRECRAEAARRFSRDALVEGHEQLYRRLLTGAR